MCVEGGLCASECREQAWKRWVGARNERPPRATARARLAPDLDLARRPAVQLLQAARQLVLYRAVLHGALPPAAHAAGVAAAAHAAKRHAAHACGRGVGGSGRRVGGRPARARLVAQRSGAGAAAGCSASAAPRRTAHAAHAAGEAAAAAAKAKGVAAKAAAHAAHAAKDLGGG